MLQVLAAILDISRDHVDNGLLSLNDSLDFQEPPLDDSATKTFKDAGPDNHIDIPGFVFQRQKQHSRGGRGSLATGDDACDLDKATMIQQFKLGSSFEPVKDILVPQYLHGMTAEGKSQAHVIGSQVICL